MNELSKILHALIESAQGLIENDKGELHDLVDSALSKLFGAAAEPVPAEAEKPAEVEETAPPVTGPQPAPVAGEPELHAGGTAVS